MKEKLCILDNLTYNLNENTITVDKTLLETLIRTSYLT